MRKIYKFIGLIIILIIYFYPTQQINVPPDKYNEVVNILQKSGYYNKLNISSVTFLSMMEVSKKCNMPEGQFAIGCTLFDEWMSYSYDIYIANEDTDWQNTLKHEIGHVKGLNEEGADKYMRENNY